MYVCKFVSICGYVRLVWFATTFSCLLAVLCCALASAA